MSGISVSQPLPHAAALQRVYSISLYAADNLRLANSGINKEHEAFAAELMNCLAEIQQTIALAMPAVPNLGG